MSELCKTTCKFAVENRHVNKLDCLHVKNTSLWQNKKLYKLRTECTDKRHLAKTLTTNKTLEQSFVKDKPLEIKLSFHKKKPTTSRSASSSVPEAAGVSRSPGVFPHVKTHNNVMRVKTTWKPFANMWQIIFLSCGFWKDKHRLRTTYLLKAFAE